MSTASRYMSDTAQCTRCHRILPVAAFSKDASNGPPRRPQGNGRKPACRECLAGRKKERRLQQRRIEEKARQLVGIAQAGADAIDVSHALGELAVEVLAEIEDPPETIGATIRAARKAMGLTQAQLAGLAGIATRALYELEMDRGSTLGTLMAVARQLNLSIRVEHA